MMGCNLTSFGADSQVSDVNYDTSFIELRWMQYEHLNSVDGAQIAAAREFYCGLLALSTEHWNAFAGTQIALEFLGGVSDI